MEPAGSVGVGQAAVAVGKEGNYGAQSEHEVGVGEVGVVLSGDGGVLAVGFQG